MTLSSPIDVDEAAPLLRWAIRDGGMARLTSLRRAVAHVVPDLDEDALVDLKLICTELVTNVHQHGDGMGELRITRPFDGVLCVEVDDASPLPPRVASGPADERSLRGWGIVDAIAKEWGVRQRDRGKTVWIEVDSGATSGWHEPPHAV